MPSYPNWWWIAIMRCLYTQWRQLHGSESCMDESERLEDEDGGELNGWDFGMLLWVVSFTDWFLRRVAWTYGQLDKFSVIVNRLRLVEMQDLTMESSLYAMEKSEVSICLKSSCNKLSMTTFCSLPEVAWVLSRLKSIHGSTQRILLSLLFRLSSIWLV